MTAGANGGDAAGVNSAARQRPRTAVLIPVFNDHDGLKRSLLSLAHDGSPFDVFVVDDGSEPPIAIPPDLPYQVHLVRQDPNQGITAALNAGIKLILAAGFEYVARLDAGDLTLPGRFAAELAFLDAHPDHALVGTHADIVDQEGRLLYRFTPPTDHQVILRRFCYENAIIHPSVMIRASALPECGLYREDYPGGEDYELWLRLSRTWKLANLDRVFVRKEETDSSITSRRLRLRVNRLRIQVAHFVPCSVHAYLGIGRSLLSLLLSRTLVFRLRRLQTRWAKAALKPDG